MARQIRRKSKSIGLAPGSLVYIGKKRTEKIKIDLINYSETIFEEKKLSGIGECSSYLDKDSKTWINITGLDDVQMFEELGKIFDIHPLVLEDILNTEQRPKIEDYDNYLFMVFKIFYYEEDLNEVQSEQVSIIFSSKYLITFQEKEDSLFKPITERIKSAKGKIRKSGTDYLAYSILDAGVDSYFNLLEVIGEKIENVEDELIREPVSENLHTIHQLRREMIILRKSVWPLREVINLMERGDSVYIKKSTGIYLRDVYDHTIQIIETIESYRDMVSGMLDTYLSSVSNRMNEVMKVLTIIATIFIPLTFIAGVYGMNFHYMPELSWKWFYPFGFWTIMASIVAVMIVYFKRKTGSEIIMENFRGSNLQKSFIGISISLLLIVTAARAQEAGYADSLKEKLIGVSDTVKVQKMLDLMKHFSQSDSEKAIRLGKEALKLSQNIGYKAGVAKSLNDIGIIKNMHGNLKDALEYYKKSLAVKQQMNDTKEIADALGSIGSVYFKLSNYPEALRYFLQSLSIRKASGSMADISVSLENIGSVYLKQGNYKKALDNFERSLKIRETTGPQHEVAKILVNIGNIYQKQGDYQKTLNILIQASRIQEATGNKKELALTLNNIGLIDIKLNNFNFASVYLFKSLEIRQSIHDLPGTAESLNSIAINYRHTNNIDKSIKYSEKSLELAQKEGEKNIERSACENLVRSYADIKNFQKAFAYQTRVIQLSDSLYNISKSRQLSNLQTSYESEKSELIIKLQNAELERQRQFIYLILGGLVITILLTIFLLKVNRDKLKINKMLEKQKNVLTEKQDIINQKNKDLEESNAVKDKFFAIIGHDLRSPIADLQSMLELLQSGDLTQNEFNGLLGQLNKRVYATRYLIDNLLNWAMTQKDGGNFNPEKINLKNVVDENIDLIKKAADVKNIVLSSNVNETEFVIADLDMIKLVIRNLLTNAVKFTPRGGKVNINSVEVNGEAEISVSDTGVGIDKDSARKLFDVTKSFSTIGTGGETGSGLGLGLCKEFIEKNSGKIWVESKPGEGSTFKFTLRKS